MYGFGNGISTQRGSSLYRLNNNRMGILRKLGQMGRTVRMVRVGVGRNVGQVELEGRGRGREWVRLEV